MKSWPSEQPAGYVKDESGESWLLKVGEEYDSVDDIRGALLLHVEGYGDRRSSDVADVEIIDNAADSYTRLNGEQAGAENLQGRQFQRR